MRRLLPEPTVRLTPREARRIAIGAQGLARAPASMPGRAAVRRLVRELGLLQIDSVNVLARAHYVPVFSRLGPYDMAGLDEDAYRGRRRRYFEYWGREASLIPVEMHPLFRWRMDDALTGRGTYRSLAAFARENRPFVDRVMAEIRDRGPLAASEIEGGRLGEKGWWGWSEAKIALEYLFWAGRITTQRRETAGFTRIYDLPERALHADVLTLATPDRGEAQRTLLRHAIAALGIATPAALRGYFRIPAEDFQLRLPELIEAGDVATATVAGFERPMLVARGASVPRKVERTALLSPFDPLVAERDRTEALFDFHYRIEIYTPEHKRQYGYYCLPVLMDDALVARLDLKADRARCALVVASAHAEPGTDAARVAERLVPELASMAKWLGLDRIEVIRRGDLAPALRKAAPAAGT